MAKAWHILATHDTPAKDRRKAISDHLAFALLVYTGLHIFVTMKAIRGDGESLLPFMALIALVAGVIPFARAVEARWDGLSAEVANGPGKADAFFRDRFLIWAGAIGCPFILTALFKLVIAAF